MLQGTVSESLFEQFCDNNRIPLARIAPNGVARHKHPDYRIVCDGHEVLVEVKEVGESGGEIEAGPDEQVHRMIHAAGKQIRGARGKYPALIVLYDDKRIARIDSVALRAAMYGQDGDLRDMPPVKYRFRAGQSVSENRNTELSAVALLTGQHDDAIRLDFYHNHYAGMPFDPDWLRSETARHYRLADHAGVGGVPGWEVS